MSLGLVVDGVRLPVAQVGPDSVYLRSPVAEISPTMATLIICVDGHERKWQVYLHDGIKSNQLDVAYF